MLTRISDQLLIDLDKVFYVEWITSSNLAEGKSLEVSFLDGGTRRYAGDLAQTIMKLLDDYVEND